MKINLEKNVVVVLVHENLLNLFGKVLWKNLNYLFVDVVNKLGVVKSQHGVLYKKTRKTYKFQVTQKSKSLNYSNRHPIFSNEPHLKMGKYVMKLIMYLEL